MGRGITVALIASLAANVFLGGFIAGRLLGAPDEPRAPSKHHRGSMMMFVDSNALSPETREAFRSAFKERRSAYRENRREIDRLRKAFGEALAVPQWSRVQAEAALAALRDAEGQIWAHRSEVLIDVFEGLPADERAALVEKMDEHSRHHRHRSRRDDRADRRAAPPETEKPEDRD